MSFAVGCESKCMSCGHIPESLLNKWGLKCCSRCMDAGEHSSEGEDQPCCERVKLRVVSMGSGVGSMVNTTSNRPMRSRQKQRAEKRSMAEVKVRDQAAINRKHALEKC